MPDRSQRRTKPSARAVPAASPRARIAFWLAGALIVGLGAAVRVWAAQDDFWLDEIWSLRFWADRASTASDVFTKFHHDNNHYLTTLWMYFCRDQPDWIVYRIPSLVAGVATIVLAMSIGRRWGIFAALFAGMLTAASYVLIVYASEARGYALAGFFALAGFLALDKYLASRSIVANIAFCVAVLLGFLSHLTFIHFYLGAVVWSLVCFFRPPFRGAKAALDLLRCHAIPVVGLAGLYAVDLSKMDIGGGPPYSLWQVVAETLNLAVGAPDPDLATRWFGLLGVAAAIAAIVLLWRAHASEWMFFAVAVFASPALLLIVRRPEVLFVRYFYVNIVFALLLLSYLAERMWRAGTPGRVAAVAGLGLLLWGNCLHTAEFLEVGRGHYLDAVKYMAAHSTEPTLRVIGDHPFRLRTVLEYYAPRLPSDRKLVYELRESDTPPGWAVLHSQERDYHPPRSIPDPLGNVYELKETFPYAGLSGFHLAVYRRKDAASK